MECSGASKQPLARPVCPPRFLAPMLRIEAARIIGVFSELSLANEFASIFLGFLAIPRLRSAVISGAPLRFGLLFASRQPRLSLLRNGLDGAEKDDRRLGSPPKETSTCHLPV